MSAVAKQKVVRFEYTLKDDAGKVIDKSDAGEPLAYLHGEGQIVPGLERALEGKKGGDAVDVVVPPGDGYGDRDPEAIFTIPKAKLPKGVNVEVGLELASRQPNGHVLRFRIAEIREGEVVADANHPLAGQRLHFSVKVVDVRDATKEELAHGHVHGPGGHHHH